MVINGKNTLIGDYELDDEYHVMVVDVEEAFHATFYKGSYSILVYLLEILASADYDGIDINDYIGQIDYQGLDYDFVENYKTFVGHALIADVVYVSSHDYAYTTIVSKGMLPMYVAFDKKINGDSRSFDELVAEVSVDMEDKIQWQSNAPVYIIAPHVNKEGVINLLRAVAEAAQSNPSSVMSTSLFAR